MIIIKLKLNIVSKFCRINNNIVCKSYYILPEYKSFGGGPGIFFVLSLENDDDANGGHIPDSAS